MEHWFRHYRRRESSRIVIIFTSVWYIEGVSKSTFSKYSFGREGGGHKEEYSVYAFDNVDNSGRSVSHQGFLRQTAWVMTLPTYVMLFAVNPLPYPSPYPPPYLPPLVSPMPMPAPVPPDDIAQWSCSACTFLNHPQLDKCEVCEMPRISVGRYLCGHSIPRISVGTCRYSLHSTLTRCQRVGRAIKSLLMSKKFR